MKIFVSFVINIIVILDYWPLFVVSVDDSNGGDDRDSRLPLAPECGRNSVGRIVGGIAAKPHVWPWTVGVYERSYWGSTEDDVIFICGASIINRRYVLTAGHCVKSYGAVTPADRFKLLVGAHNRKNSGQWAKVERVIVNSKYEDVNMQYDIALFKLKEPLDFQASNHTVAPICLADASMTKDDFTKESAVVVGWGTTKAMGEISDVLMQVSVPVVSKKDCIKAYDEPSITDLNICAGYKEGRKDSCQGDSGGPLALRRKNYWMQIGITSWGRGCAEKDAYGVYTRVTSHIKWIYKMISKHSRSNSTLIN